MNDMQKRGAIKTVAALFTCAIALAPARAQDSAARDNAARAESAVRRMEENQTFSTSVTKLKLDVANSFGVTSNEFTTYSRKGGDVLVVITAGPDRGQKVLRQKGNIYLYYPDAEEVIWLKGSALKDSIMGSDFSYEDLTDEGTVTDRYAVAYVGDETLDGSPCIRVTLTARTRNETYAKQELWIDARLFVARKTILYSASGKAMRQLLSDDIRSVSGKNAAFANVMKDLLKKNSETKMTIVSMEVGNPIPAKYFNREELSW
ncbi:MAG TPA: outer membrane lipoprotein-sorting protein [Treponemataceae bacterium]|nr:outer membrane lipoprotein-sorting protein [Treponemataceae bacterium]